MTDLLFLALGLIVAGITGWKAVSSEEDRLWHGLGSLGWAVLALSGVTDGLLKFGVIGVSLAVFALGLLFRQTSLGRDVDAARGR